MSKAKKENKNTETAVNNDSKEEQTTQENEELTEKDGKPEEAENPLKAEVEDLKKQLEEQKNNLMRTAAEYANFRNRTEREKTAIYGNAISDAVKNILPIADSIDSALKAMENAPEEYKKGVELVKAQITKAFDSLNITAFGEVGDKFNPDIYNAVSHIENEDMEENTVSMVFQKGYKYNDKVIRHCMVQVAN